MHNLGIGSRDFKSQLAADQLIVKSAAVRARDDEMRNLVKYQRTKTGHTKKGPLDRAAQV